MLGDALNHPVPTKVQSAGGCNRPGANHELGQQASQCAPAPHALNLGKGSLAGLHRLCKEEICKQAHGVSIKVLVLGFGKHKDGSKRPTLPNLQNKRVVCRARLLDFGHSQPAELLIVVRAPGCHKPTATQHLRFQNPPRGLMRKLDRIFVSSSAAFFSTAAHCPFIFGWSLHYGLCHIQSFTRNLLLIQVLLESSTCGQIFGLCCRCWKRSSLCQALVCCCMRSSKAGTTSAGSPGPATTWSAAHLLS